MLGQVAMKEKTAQAWATIETMFASQTRARVLNMWFALVTAQKAVTDYVGKIQALGDEMSAARRPLDDAKLVEYIIT